MTRACNTFKSREPEHIGRTLSMASIVDGHFVKQKPLPRVCLVCGEAVEPIQLTDEYAQKYGHDNIGREYPHGFKNWWVWPRVHNKCIDLEGQHSKTARILARSGLVYPGMKIFESYKPKNESQQQAFQAMWTFADKGGVGRGPGLVGSSGVGKTHLMQAAVYTLCKSDVEARYISLPNWRQEVRSRFKNVAEATSHEFYLKTERVRVLFIDDLGIGKATDWVEEVVFLLMNNRIEWKKSTSIAMDITPAQLGRRYDKDETGEMRIPSRFYRLCQEIITIYGEDQSPFL